MSETPSPDTENPRIIENQEFKSNNTTEPPKYDRRELFVKIGNIFRQNKDEDENEHQAEAQRFLEDLHALLDKKITRRQVVVGGAAGGVLVLDEFFLHGKGRYLLTQLITNREFREKLWDSLQSGELLEEDIPRLLREIVGTPDYTVELSERVDLHEQWLDDTFANYEVRKVLRNQQDDGRFVLIADADIVGIIEAEEVPTTVIQGAHVADFPATAAKNPNFAVLPRPQMSKNGFIGIDDIEYVQLTPRMWTTFQRQDGSIYEQKDADGTRNFRGGALVLVENRLRVVDASDLAGYQVGENCRGIQVCAYTVRSEHQEEDLAAIDTAKTLSGLSPNDPTYCSFVATFETPDGQNRTHLLSIYNHIDSDTGEVTGAEWPYLDQLNVSQATEICNQIMQEKNYSSFTLSVPDPDDFSAVIGSEIYTDQEVQTLSDVGNFEVNHDSKYYQPEAPFARSLWSQPYAQPQIPLMFIAAMK